MSKFTDFDVMRVGDTVVLSAFVDGDQPTGKKMQVRLTLSSHDEAVLFESWMQRLCACASVYEEVPDDALNATLQLMKGKTS